MKILEPRNFLAVVCALLLCPALARAAPLFEEIEARVDDSAYRARLEAIKDLGLAGLKSELEALVEAARLDLDEATVERDILEPHFNALANLLVVFERVERFEAFGEVKINQFTLDEDDCVIADPTFDNFAELDCDAEYRHAIDVWRRTEIANRILNTWKASARADSLARIRASEVRWEQFAAKVTSDQFPWETIVNGWLVEGTVATPPRHQFRLVHPIAVLSYAEEEGEYDEEIGIEVFGLRSYGEQYDPEWGLSVFALLESGNATDTGWGVSLSRASFTFAVVEQDTVGKPDDTKILLGYNLARLFENKKNELADKRRELLDRLDRFKADLDALAN